MAWERGVFDLDGEEQTSEDLLRRVGISLVPLDLVHVLQGPVGRRKAHVLPVPGMGLLQFAALPVLPLGPHLAEQTLV